MTSILHLAAVVGVGLGLLTFVILALSGLAMSGLAADAAEGAAEVSPSARSPEAGHAPVAGPAVGPPEASAA